MPKKEEDFHDENAVLFKHWANPMLSDSSYRFQEAHPCDDTPIFLQKHDVGRGEVRFIEEDTLCKHGGKHVTRLQSLYDMQKTVTGLTEANIKNASNIKQLQENAAIAAQYAR